MIPGRLLAAILTVLPAASPAGVLAVERAGAPLLSLEVAEGQGWCLRWHHSVTGGPVADCFQARGGRMILHRSYLHDYAAGLGEVPGRGHVRPAPEGGYWIEDIDEAIPDNALPLRVGRPSTGHRLVLGGVTHDLSAMAAGERVVLHLIP
ncbi:DUF1850 domain-containing protein [Pseudoroseicyclus aestuarii]|uniref:DUF1850 domain-containing protein n=1 Tax=Pseudoroseicyclus aestuarii TaxID=1795041 RepID=A0A318SVG9_9RHOB|nr:DUF1850 domain-containing protein [Pseudoroseicyclus aestuarii]PYE85603.1 hypothetical protein DFP88_101271 [Pseudoroseicyclus aestuarii]